MQFRTWASRDFFFQGDRVRHHYMSSYKSWFDLIAWSTVLNICCFLLKQKKITRKHHIQFGLKIQRNELNIERIETLIITEFVFTDKNTK